MTTPHAIECTLPLHRATGPVANQCRQGRHLCLPRRPTRQRALPVACRASRLMALGCLRTTPPHRHGPRLRYVGRPRASQSGTDRRS